MRKVESVVDDGNHDVPPSPGYIPGLRRRNIGIGDQLRPIPGTKVPLTFEVRVRGYIETLEAADQVGLRIFHLFPFSQGVGHLDGILAGTAGHLKQERIG